MKYFLPAIALSFMISARASIEYVESEQSHATPEEIQQSRACFKEVARNGCGDPGEDPRHFRLCLKNTKETLTKDCKKMMTELYGK